MGVCVLCVLEQTERYEEVLTYIGGGRLERIYGCGAVTSQGYVVHPSMGYCIFIIFGGESVTGLVMVISCDR